MMLNNKKILVIGTALSGIATTEFLLSKGSKVILTDTKPKEKIDKYILELEKHPNLKGIYGMQPPLDILESIDYIIISPGVPMGIPIVQKAKDKNIEVLSEIELSYRLTENFIIAITGTNGKTTTTALVGHMFKNSKKESCVVGNIGLPMISQVEKGTKNSCFITEVSSFQLEGIKYFKPNISAILNITPDHLDRHKTFENYILEKSKVFINQDKKDITILNADDPVTLSLRKQLKSKVILFSRLSILDQGIYVKNNEIIIKDNDEEHKICSVLDIKIQGLHNLENALAASGIAYYSGIPIEIIKETLKEFQGVSHRMEKVDRIKGVDFINDSKATNPESAIKAIESIDQPIILIAGGMNKGTSFDGFINSFNGKIKHLVLLGETKNIIESTANKQGFYNITKVDDLQNAILQSFKKANLGDVVLLSPACASWDMFESFEERGDLFKAIVRSLRRPENDEKKSC